MERFLPSFRKNNTILLPVLLLVLLLSSKKVVGQVTITTFTGGANISADRASNAQSPLFTTLTNITIAETTNKALGDGSFTLEAPLGWVFNTTGVTVSSSTQLSGTVVYTSSTVITISMNGYSNGSRQSFVISGLSVRAVDGGALPSSGNVRIGSPTGASTVLNNDFSITSGTSVGSLSQVLGSMSRLVVTLPGQTFTDGATFASSGNTGTVTPQTVGTAFTIVRLTATDQFFNLVSGYSGTKTITYSGPGSSTGGNPTYTTTVTFGSGVSSTSLVTTLRRAQTTTITATENGSFGFASSNLVVNPMGLTVSSPLVTTKIYDGTTAAQLTGTLNGVLSGDLVVFNGTGEFATKDVGSGKTVTSTSTLGGADGGNYVLTQPTGLTGTITPRGLTITAANATKCFGTAYVLGSTAFTSNGLVGGDTVTGVTLTSAGAGAGAATGTYAIVPSAAVGTSLSNYTISYVDGTLTVSPSPVGGLVSGKPNFCSGANSGLLTLSGYSGTIVRWESSVSPFTTWTPIAHTGATYTSGPLTEDTKFRAVLSACGEVASGEATLTLATTTWNGSAWTGGAPTADKTLVIAGNYTSAGSNSNLFGCSLTVQNNAVVTILSQDSVVLTGPLTVAPGSTMTMESRSNLLQTGASNLNSGTVVFKVNSAPMRRLDYTLWSSPVAGQLLQPFSPLTFANRFYSYDSNANAYAVVPNINTTPFATAKGYLIRVANNHPAVDPQVWTGTFTGTPNNGDYSFPLANFGPGKRFTLIGNPYPSPIDPEQFILHPDNAAAITGTLYLFRKTNGSGKPSYCTFNLGGFTSNGEAHSDMVANLPYQVIQTGQGFFVEGTGAGSGNVVFTNSMRVNDRTDSFMRTGATAQMTSTVERHRVWLNVTNEAGLFSQTMIGYMGNATDGVDVNYDGKYINDGAVALASVLNAEPYAIQSKGLPFAATDVVPLHFAATTAGTYVIAIDKVDGLFAEGQAVYLQDSLTGTVHNLTEGPYSFATEAGTFNSRFEVRYQSTTLGTTTPVLSENQVVIYKTPSNEISINTGNFVMDSVVIYDLAGRLLFEQKDINNSQALIKVGLATEVLLVKIKTQDGKSVTKKVLFPRTTLKKEFKTSNIQMAEDE